MIGGDNAGKIQILCLLLKILPLTGLFTAPRLLDYCTPLPSSMPISTHARCRRLHKVLFRGRAPTAHAAKKGNKKNTASALRKERRRSRPCLLLIDCENVRGAPLIRWKLSRQELKEKITDFLEENNLLQNSILVFDHSPEFSPGDDGQHPRLENPLACRTNEGDIKPEFDLNVFITNQSGYVVAYSGSNLKADDVIAMHIPRATGGTSDPEKHQIWRISHSNYTRHLNILNSNDFARQILNLESVDTEVESTFNGDNTRVPSEAQNTEPTVEFGEGRNENKVDSGMKNCYTQDLQEASSSECTSESQHRVGTMYRVTETFISWFRSA